MENASRALIMAAGILVRTYNLINISIWICIYLTRIKNDNRRYEQKKSTRV